MFFSKQHPVARFGGVPGWVAGVLRWNLISYLELVQIPPIPPTEGCLAKWARDDILSASFTGISLEVASHHGSTNSCGEALGLWRGWDFV